MANTKFSKTQLSKMAEFLPLLAGILSSILSGKIILATITMGLIKNNSNILKSEKYIPKFLLNAGINTTHKMLNKKISSVMGS